MKKRRTLREMAETAQDDVWKCPRCGCRDWRVASTYLRKDGYKRRTIYCRNCKYTMQTLERPLAER